MFYEVLQRIVSLAAQNDVQIALQQLLEQCVRATNAATGSIFFLRHSERAYVETVVSQRSQHEPPRTIPALATVDEDDLHLRFVIANRRPLDLRAVSGKDTTARPGVAANSRLLVPIVQDDVCLGVFELIINSPDGFTEEHKHLLRLAANLALMLSEKEYTLNLLATLHTPIAYDLPDEKFLDAIMIQVAKAARMPYIVLRRISDGSLRCQKAYGINLEPSALDIESIEGNPPFRRAIETRTPQVEDRVDQPYAQELLGNLHLDDLVKSFIVVPILVGDDVYGTLSFAVACPHSYTALEQHGLTMVANAVGVALANYENFHKAQARIFEEAKISAAITTVDVAQSARHEAKNLIQSSQEQLGVVRAQKVTPPKLRRLIAELTESISHKLFDVGQELDKIRAVTKAPERVRSQCRLDVLWKEAFSLVAGRLKALQVRHSVTGTAVATVAADYMRHAFLNLILNSIDAFRDSKRRKGREIVVDIDEQAPRARVSRTRYRDNATGIDPSSLRPEPVSGRPNVLDIFESGVTSKDDGSGYGLYLVRKILNDHHGSIYLADYINRTVFDIEIPKDHVS